MNATQQLHALGQSLWLDNITLGLLLSGTLGRYINELSATGLTSNPTIFEHAIKEADFFDDAIRQKALAGEALFFELALEDLTQAADLFRPIHDATGGVDGWVSPEVSPLLVDDTAGTIKAAARLHARAQRSNLFIKIPGTAAGIPAIEETIFAGVPVNVTLLFSCEHYIAAAEAYMRVIERRIAVGLDPAVASVVSIFVSRWDVAIEDKVPDALRNRLGIAIAFLEPAPNGIGHLKHPPWGAKPCAERPQALPHTGRTESCWQSALAHIAQRSRSQVLPTNYQDYCHETQKKYRPRHRLEWTHRLGGDEAAEPAFQRRGRLRPQGTECGAAGLHPYRGGPYLR